MSTGIFSTSSASSTQSYIVPSFAQAITRLMPNGTAPLFVMTSQAGEETALQPEHGFFTKTMIFPQVTLSASALSTDTTITVSSTTNIIPGMMMRNQTTKEQFMVTAVSSATQIQVSRGIGSTAATMSSSQLCYQVGTAFEESSLRPNALSINPVKITNYTQIIRNTWAVSGSAAATQVIAGDTITAENRGDCAKLQANDIEKAIIFSQKSSGTLNGQPFRTMDGLVNITSTLAYYPPTYAAANVYTAGSTTNYTQLEGFFDPCFNQVTDPASANTRVLFVGATARKVLNNIGRLNSTYYMVNGETSYGLQFTQFKIARGTFNMVEHPLLNSNADWMKMAIAVDINGFKLAYLGGRKTQRKEFNQSGDVAQDNGIDAIGGTLTTEVTTVVKNPPANAVVDNFTAAAAG